MAVCVRACIFLACYYPAPAPSCCAGSLGCCRDVQRCVVGRTHRAYWLGGAERGAGADAGAAGLASAADAGKCEGTCGAFAVGKVGQNADKYGEQELGVAQQGEVEELTFGACGKDGSMECYTLARDVLRKHHSIAVGSTERDGVAASLFAGTGLNGTAVYGSQ